MVIMVYSLLWVMQGLYHLCHQSIEAPTVTHHLPHIRRHTGKGLGFRVEVLQTLHWMVFCLKGCNGEPSIKTIPRAYHVTCVSHKSSAAPKWRKFFVSPN